MVENSEEKARTDHVFNPLLASYFNVNYLGFLFLSFFKKERSTAQHSVDNAKEWQLCALSEGYKYHRHGELLQTQPGKVPILFFIAANLVKPTPTQV